MNLKIKLFLNNKVLVKGYSTPTGSLKSVEAYNPHTKKICKLPDLPYAVYGHTLCGGLLCGGYGGLKSCLKLGPLGFVKATVTLQQNRRDHLCWNVAQGILLLGGNDSSTTTELVVRDGSASMLKFNLMYPARSPS